MVWSRFLKMNFYSLGIQRTERAMGGVFFDGNWEDCCESIKNLELLLPGVKASYCPLWIFVVAYQGMISTSMHTQIRLHKTFWRESNFQNWNWSRAEIQNSGSAFLLQWRSKMRSPISSRKFSRPTSWCRQRKPWCSYLCSWRKK